MYLEITRRRNPDLIETALRLHRAGQVPPNTYVLDLDAIQANAGLLAREAKRLGLELYFMTKQVGRNPQLMKAVAEAGISRGVAVDIDDARAFAEAGVALGHVGHLVQIPRAWLPQVLRWQPEVVTTFDYGSAKLISEAAVAQGRVQPLLLRLAGELFYPAQEGGITLAELPQVAQQIAELPGVRVVGVTAFPVLLASAGRVQATPNLTLVQEGAAMLRHLGFTVSQLNGPSLSTVRTLQLLAEAGITHAEPGHALTGTIPTAFAADQPELPAFLYLTEVSHNYAGDSYCYGGGRYPRGEVQTVLVGSGAQEAAVAVPGAEHIDYYWRLPGGRFAAGEPVITAFRAQAFTSRANLALVSGGRLVGLYDRGNQPLEMK